MDDPPWATHPHSTPAEVALEPTASGLVYLFASDLVAPVTRWDRAWTAITVALGFVAVGLPCIFLIIFAEDLATPVKNVLSVLAGWDLAWPAIVLTIGAVVQGLRYGGPYVSKRVTLLAPWSIRGGVKVPCGDSEVRKQPLGTLLFAVALWSLREQGRVTLASVEEPTWLPIRKRRRIMVSTLKRVPSSGLESRIMTYVPLGVTSNLVSIMGWVVAEESQDPWNAVVVAVADEVSDLGQDCAKRATLAGAVHDFTRRWQCFQTSEPMLYAALLDECARGIAARKQGKPVSKGKRKGTDGGFDFDPDSNSDHDFDGD